MRRYGCGTDKEFCTSSRMETQMGMQNVHGTPEQAFRCYKRYLINRLGFEAIGQRELRAPAGNPLGVIGILILPKPSHFGAIFRGGKREKIHTASRLNQLNGRAGYIA